MRRITMEISGHTRLLCLIGSPVAHSGSPAMHNYSFEKLGLDYRYLAFDIKEEDTKKAIEALKMMNFRGCNITMPGKTVAASCCDELSKAAQLTGAINTIVNEDGKLVGHITDGTGWIRNCLEHGFDIHGKKLIIAGTGGAGTAIQIAAALGGAKKIVILARKSSPRFANGEETVRKIREHVPECQAEIFDLEDAEVLRRELADADLFCNATKVGMKPMDDQSVIPDVSMLRPELVVSDIVYNPRETKLLKDAKKAGCKVIPGIGMLLWQGAEAFRLYTGNAGEGSAGAVFQRIGMGG